MNFLEIFFSSIKLILTLDPLLFEIIILSLKVSLIALIVSSFYAVIIGYILDSWFDSKPWLIIIFFFVGAAAGITNVVRSAKLMQKNVNKKQ